MVVAILPDLTQRDYEIDYIVKLEKIQEKVAMSYHPTSWYKRALSSNFHVRW